MSRGHGPFVCAQCGQKVSTNGAQVKHRNHCPRCLWSRHLDVNAGDRQSSCGGMMEPIAISVRGNGEWSIVHRCRRCGALDVNTIAGDDNELALMSLAVRPLAQPPFPIHVLPFEESAG
jgi:hypothetical protein